jgi:hypothetical protein
MRYPFRPKNHRAAARSKEVAMRKKCLLATALVLVVLAAGPACAGERDAEAEVNGLTLSLGYEAGYLRYAEKSARTGSTLDTDTGWLHGGYAEARYDFPRAFARLKLDAMGSSSARYDGSLLNGTPYSTNTSEFIAKSEADLGYKLFEEGRTTFSPYLGVGYRYWRRGENSGADYTELYTWWYGAAGLNVAHRSGRWILGADAALLYPMFMKMTTTMGGNFDSTTFHIKPLPGVRLELPVQYELGRDIGTAYSIFLTPYYERWDIGKSPNVRMTRGGVTTGNVFYEPKSGTDIFGLRLGFSVNL